MKSSAFIRGNLHAQQHHAAASRAGRTDTAYLEKVLSQSQFYTPSCDAAEVADYNAGFIAGLLKTEPQDTDKQKAS